MLSVQVFGPGGNDRNTAPEYFGLMGVAHGPLRKRYSGKGRAVPERLPVDPRPFFTSLRSIQLAGASITRRGFGISRARPRRDTGCERLFVQAAWVLLVKPKSLQRHGPKPCSRRPRSGCTITSSPSRSPITSPALLLSEEISAPRT